MPAHRRAARRGRRAAARWTSRMTASAARRRNARSASSSAPAATTSSIGRGLLGSLGARIAQAAAGRKRARSSPTRLWRGIISRRPRPRWRRPASRARAIVVPPGEGTKASPTFEQVCDATARRAHRAQRSGGCARRRRGRRSCRLRRGDRAARPRFRAGADDAAGAGRLFGRRQDRHQFRATARI